MNKRMSLARHMNKFGSPMRFLLWVTFASFVLYHAAILPPAVRGRFPSVASYLYGLLLFLGPFVVLLAAAIVGLARHVANFCAGLGAIVLAVVAWLVATGQALFVAPTFVMFFGAFSLVVLLGALAVRVGRSVLDRANRS